MAEPIGTGHPLGRSDWLRDGHGTRQGPGEALRFLPCGFGEETRAGSFRVRGGGRARPGDADLPATGSRSLSVKPAPPEPAARGCSRVPAKALVKFTLFGVWLFGFGQMRVTEPTQRPGRGAVPLLPPRPSGLNLCSETLPGPAAGHRPAIARPSSSPPGPVSPECRFNEGRERAACGGRLLSLSVMRVRFIRTPRVGHLSCLTARAPRSVYPSTGRGTFAKTQGDRC